MGNSSTKEARTSTGSRPDSFTPTSPNPDNSTSHGYNPNDRRPPNSRNGRSRHDALLELVGASSSNNPEQRRETKPEREARKAAKERALRLKERERSLKEESIDGGYLVTLGTYTGPEDFSKPVVRQLMLERRLAPFWRGLNDHSDSWTEYQLVAAARGMPIPAPDEIPSDLTMSRTPPSSVTGSRPIPARAESALQASTTSQSAGQQQNSPASQLFRGRSKTLASLTSKNDSQVEITPQEIQLPHEPLINGQLLEAQLYKDVMECPICFMYYPPYLNHTRCCDQPICSECFVQIKRPDPHAPEHLDPNSPVPQDIQRLEQEAQLISEPAACPFCVQNEFGITYEPPPFRRGLAYANNAFSRNATAAPSSLPTTLQSSGLAPYRRRGQSISANAPGVITTDKVRPDWAKKLSDARSQAARRSAAATALHTAAYQMGGDPTRLGFGRRRRHLIYDPQGGENGEARPIPNMEMLMAVLGDQGSSRGRRATAADGVGSRFSSRSSRADEIEELMMMEAIRQSLAAEEERKKKDDKDAAKQAKKDDKAKMKEAKKSEKAAKKNGLYNSSSNTSSFFSSPHGSSTPAAPGDEASISGGGKGKGRAPSGSGPPSNATLLGFNPLSEPSSTLNNPTSAPSAPRNADAQARDKSTTASSSGIFETEAGSTTTSTQTATPLGSRPRKFSDTSSSNSSVDGSGSGASTSFQEASDSPQGAATGGDPLVTFGSLAGMIDRDDSAVGSGGEISNITAGLESAPGVRGLSGEAAASSTRVSPANVERGTNEIIPVQMTPNGPAKVGDGRYDHKEHGYFSITEDAGGGRQVSH